MHTPIVLMVVGIPGFSHGFSMLKKKQITFWGKLRQRDLSPLVLKEFQFPPNGGKTVKEPNPRKESP